VEHLEAVKWTAAIISLSDYIFLREDIESNIYHLFQNLQLKILGLVLKDLEGII